MSERRARRRIAGALAGAALLGAVTAGTATAADTSVAIAGFAYDPAAVTVSVGDTVTWTNGDGVGHTATADDASFTTGTIAGGGSGSVTFSTAGTFAYHCAIHPAMTGTITVQAATGGGGAAATTPPTDAAPSADASRDGSGEASVALLVLAGTWLVGIIVVRRRFVGPDWAIHSGTDSSAGNPPANRDGSGPS